MTSVIRKCYYGGHMNIGSASIFLRRVLWADAAVSLAMALLLIFGASAIASLTALPEMLLSGAGWVLMPWVALVAFTATRNPLRTRLAWLVVALNVVWVVESGFLLAMDSIKPNALGVAFVLAQASGVLALAALQATGLLALRRQAAA
jgi:hypothetical protein